MLDTSLINESERLTKTFKVSSRGEEFGQCWREACNHVFILRPTENDDDDIMEYPNDVVVLSIAGGRIKVPFCSTLCAAYYLVNASQSKNDRRRDYLVSHIKRVIDPDSWRDNICDDSFDVSDLDSGDNLSDNVGVNFPESEAVQVIAP